MTMKTAIATLAASAALTATGVAVLPAPTASAATSCAVTRSVTFTKGHHCGINGYSAASKNAPTNCKNLLWSQLGQVRAHNGRNVYFSGCRYTTSSAYPSYQFSFSYDI